MPMTTEQLKQLERVLEERYFTHIPSRTDGNVKGWTEQQHRVNRLSRSLAAFSVSKLIDLTEAKACQAVIDGSDDNGIDALYFDAATKQLVLLYQIYTQVTHKL
jgi:hypothetical protein